jgi:DNA relaxase NicK
MEMLGISDKVQFETIKSYYGYEHCIIFDGVRIHWTDNLKLSEVCIDLSGKGCRTVEWLNENKFDWYDFFHDLYYNPVTQKLDFQGFAKQIHISRLDVACDEMADSDKEGILDFDTMVNYVKARKFICRATCKPWWSDGRKRELLFGSEHSDRLLRIYDKALEQKNMLSKDQPELLASIPVHWIRAEFQLRNDNALSFLMNWLKVNDLGRCYSGVMNDYLRFVTHVVNRDVDHHSDRYNITRWWRKFLGTSLKLPQAYIIGREFSLSNVWDYLKSQAGSSIRTVLEAEEGDISKLLKIADDSKLNQKQRIALSAWDKDREEAARKLPDYQKERVYERNAFIIAMLECKAKGMISDADFQFIQKNAPDRARYPEKIEASKQNLAKLRAELFDK